MSNRMYEICGNCGKRYGLHIDISCPDNFNSVFEPTGKYEGENMSDKIQMTEEQARELYERCIYDDSITTEKLFIMNLSANGYIIKSELQQKVEEAEESWEHYRINCLSPDFESDDRDEIIIELHQAFVALKQSHPEFKK